MWAAAETPVPDEATARRMARELDDLGGDRDWYVNTTVSREDRRRWHDLGLFSAPFSGGSGLAATLVQFLTATDRPNRLNGANHEPYNRSGLVSSLCDTGSTCRSLR